MADSILEVVQVRKRYGETVALDGVSFEVEQGEMFGLLGPNGAGKTTLLSIISCQLEATTGAVRVLGKPLDTHSREARTLIGIVPQDLALYAQLSARENLEFFGGLYSIEREELRRRAGQLLDSLGLTERADDLVDTLSGGLKRRLNLAAALLHQPRLLLLDEPTTGVDPQSRQQIFAEIRRLNADGVTVLYTSHYMEEVQALCPRIGIIDHGRLIACDMVKALLREVEGIIRFGVRGAGAELADRVRGLPEVQLRQSNGRLELLCRDVRASLPRLVATLRELRLQLTSLEVHEPNLERVFLHLTGHGLRD